MEENKDLNAPIEDNEENLEAMETPAEEIPAEEAPAVEGAAAEVSAEVIPAEEVPTEEVPTEEVPAAEAAEEKSEKFTFALLWAKILAFWSAVKLTVKGWWAKFMGLKKSTRVTITIVAIVLLLLIFILALAYGYYRDKIGQLRPDETRDPNATISSSEFNDWATDPFGSELEDLLGNLPTVDATFPSGGNNGDRPDYLDHVTNILLIGTDERSEKFTSKARGDSCMLLSINTAGEKPVVSLISFERGMGMPILSGKYKGQWDWLTHLFRYGGAEMMMESIEACFDIEINYYIRTNFHCFRKGIDALGGVDIKFTTREAEYFQQTWNENMVKGMNHLDGKNALRFARLRVIDSDWKRVERQRKVISAVITKLKSKNLTELNDLIDLGTTLVRTNLTEDVITKLLLDMVPGLKGVTVQQMTIPQKGTYGSQKVMGDRSAYAPDFEVNTQLIHDMIYGLNKDAE